MRYLILALLALALAAPASEAGCLFRGRLMGRLFGRPLFVRHAAYTGAGACYAGACVPAYGAPAPVMYYSGAAGGACAGGVCR